MKTKVALMKWSSLITKTTEKGKALGLGNFYNEQTLNSVLFRSLQVLLGFENRTGWEFTKLLTLVRFFL